ncbi:hypothetical protein [Tsukamurella pseudospumae]|uniref:hypothetical protein n=1 Tax=Tsukamurella pseudospumae TaxID=239498 RepID=UPI0011128620|nr:hypothetical protein [Tsukamurella pseudospumae]
MAWAIRKVGDAVELATDSVLSAVLEESGWDFDKLVLESVKLRNTGYSEFDVSPEGASELKGLTGRWIEWLTVTLVRKLLTRVLKETVSLEEVLRVVRICGLLACPDPQSHERVWNECVIPLFKYFLGLEDNAENSILAAIVNILPNLIHRTDDWSDFVGERRGFAGAFYSE